MLQKIVKPQKFANRKNLREYLASAKEQRKIWIIHDQPFVKNPQKMAVMMTDEEIAAAKLKFPDLIIREPLPDENIAELCAPRNGQVAIIQKPQISKAEPQQQAKATSAVGMTFDLDEAGAWEGN
jgi:hypothetical protein